MIVKCPACGTDVSDMATKCPKCNISLEKPKIKEEKPIKKKEESRPVIKCLECGKELEHKEKICPVCGFPMGDKESVKRANELKFLKEQSERKPDKQSLLFFLVFLFALFVGIITWEDGSFGSVLLVLGGGFMTLVMGGSYLSEISDINKKQEELKLAQSDYEKYKKQKIAQQNAMIASAQIANQQYIKTHPECPYCKSRNTKKISTTGKAVSVATVGLLSNKIGKQWHCNNCKSNF